MVPSLISVHARENKSGRQIWDNFGTFWYENFFWHIHARGNKSGRQIWDNFGTFWYKTFSGIYLGMEINRAAKFGMILSLFGMKPNFSQLPLVALLCSKILNFLNNHFGHLTSLIFYQGIFIFLQNVWTTVNLVS